MTSVGREELERWQESRSENFYEASPNLAHGLRARLGDISTMEPRLLARHVTPGYDPEADPGYAGLLGRVLDEEAALESLALARR